MPISTEVSTGMLGVVKIWGDINVTDAVWDVHYLTVTDPVVFASMAEMETYGDSLAMDADYAKFLVAVQKASTHLGASIVQDVKAWGPSTLKAVTQ